MRAPSADPAAVPTTPAALPGESPAILLADLAKQYRRVTALRSLTLRVEPGEVFGFLGPNGAGKTTAVKLLLGLTHRTGGEGWVLGAPLGDRHTRRRIGYLPELFRYQDWLSAREVLALHCKLARLPRARWADEVDVALRTVGLLGRERDRVGTFSKGMQQRLGLGAALLGRPDLVVLDEPTSALDPVGRHDVREIIHQLRERGATVFLNSHLLTEVEHVCDHVAIVDHGLVIAEGSLADLLNAEGLLRMRLGAIDGTGLATLARYGTVTCAEGWHEVRGIAQHAVPDLVADLVAQGIRVYAVEPRRLSLEERFLQLLGATPDGHTDDRQPDPA